MGNMMDSNAVRDWVGSSQNRSLSVKQHSHTLPICACSRDVKGSAM
jgi:hypothetical protein